MVKRLKTLPSKDPDCRGNAWQPREICQVPVFHVRLRDPSLRALCDEKGRRGHANDRFSIRSPLDPNQWLTQSGCCSLSGASVTEKHLLHIAQRIIYILSFSN